jgi:hypothetical protein
MQWSKYLIDPLQMKMLQRVEVKKSRKKFSSIEAVRTLPLVLYRCTNLL